MLVTRLGRLFAGSTKTKAASTLLADKKKVVRVSSDFNKQGLLEKILQVFNDRSIDLYSINGKVVEKDATGLEKCQFEISFDNSKPKNFELIQESIRSLNLGVEAVKAPVVDWFPMKEDDLDLMGHVLQTPGDGLGADHPGFNDKEYRKRRDIIADKTLGYKMKDPIPRIEYAPEETELWSYIYNKVRPLHRKFGCKEYQAAMNNFEKEGMFSPDFIPQQQDLNEWLRKNSNWRLKPVNGILSQREFLNSLAFRTFCCTQYIRHPSKPDYTPEPDIMHEYLGHVPNFADPYICEISQHLGMLSLGASDSQVETIGAIYWFTIEFGLCMEGDEVKFYGAGPGGSFGEVHHIENMIKNHKDKIYRLDIINNPVPVKFVVQDVQPFYYAADSFKNFLEQLERYAETFHKPFNLRYDQATNSFEVDRAIDMKSKPDS